MKENGIMIKYKDMESLLGLMEINSNEIGMMIK